MSPTTYNRAGYLAACRAGDYARRAAVLERIAPEDRASRATWLQRAARYRAFAARCEARTARLLEARP